MPLLQIFLDVLISTKEQRKIGFYAHNMSFHNTDVFPTKVPYNISIHKVKVKKSHLNEMSGNKLNQIHVNGSCWTEPFRKRFSGWLGTTGNVDFMGRVQQ